MSEALERAARAICEGRCLLGRMHNDPCVDPATRMNGPCKASLNKLALLGPLDDAKRVLAAIREPSEAMIEAGSHVDINGGEYILGDRAARETWNTMIGAALK